MAANGVPFLLYNTGSSGAVPPVPGGFRSMFAFWAGGATNAGTPGTTSVGFDPGSDYSTKHTYSRIPLRSGRKRRLEGQLEEIAELEAIAARLKEMPAPVLVEAKRQVAKLELDANNLAFDLFRQITVADRAKHDEAVQLAKTQRERVMRVAAFAEAERARIIDEEEAILLLLA